MISCKVVLSNGEHDEHELTTCSQGVVLELDACGRVDVVDVASDEVVALQTEAGWCWGRDIGPYSRLFVHAVDAPALELATGAHRDGDESHDVLLEPWSTRTTNLMRRYGFKTVEEIARQTEGYIHHLPGVGVYVIEEIRLSLQTYGLDYREET